MSYFQFLLVFLGIPILVFLAITIRDQKLHRHLPPGLRNLPYWLVLLVHLFVAVIYTTPWDNYLVATGVWFYDPRLVTGIRLGWVPIEEYTFFIVQTFLFGLVYLAFARRFPEPADNPRPRLNIRWISAAGMLGIGLIGVILFLAHMSAWTYLGLILLWAGPPIAIQFGFGADLLWQYRKLVIFSILPLAVYLGIADSLAIGSGTWTISPNQSLQIFLPGGLPLEEFIFFLATNCLIGFGMTLALERESRQRFTDLRIAIMGKLNLNKEEINQDDSLQIGVKSGAVNATRES